MRESSRKISRPLLGVILVGFLIRLAFVFWGATIFYGAGREFINNDTFSYTDSFLNLFHHGVFSFDLSHPDAYYGRLPGYPFFWGAHYVILGPDLVYWGVAISQAILDSIAIFFVFQISLQLSKSAAAAWFTALIYAGYPFVIVWTTISGTETLGCFFTILFFYWLICKPVTTKHILISGLLIGCAFYVREYLGILLLSAYLSYFFKLGFRNFKVLSKAIILVTLTFSLLYILWPIRNYISTDRFILLKTKTSGYHRYAEDIVSARAWLYSWTNDADAYLDSIAHPDYHIKFPDQAFPSVADMILAENTIELARTCGSGFYFWHHNKKSESNQNCNLLIEKNFNQLQQNYKESNPIRYYSHVPLNNLRKAVFKSVLTDGSHSYISKLLFNYRTLLLLIAFAGIILSLKNSESYALIFFTSFIYIFITFFIRQVEMRYLLQADVILIIFTSVFFAWVLKRLEGTAFEEFIQKKLNA